ncbi:hypothetical protein TNCV_3553431 [Trichonephila clavipes]|nr:hypothetical protein TNCV_3553431 [Trichonephila clavipes]
MVWASGQERGLLHSDRAKDALDRPIVERPSHHTTHTQSSNCLITRHPNTSYRHQCHSVLSQGAWLETVAFAPSVTCSVNDTHSLSTSFGVT